MLDERALLSSSDWFESVVARCQVFIGKPRPTEFNIVDVASTFVHDLPDARCPGEDLLLRALLLDVADRWGVSLHEDVHRRRNAAACGFDTATTLRVFLNSARGHAKRGFLEWARHFRIELHRVHPVSAARLAAALIREPDGERADAASLATVIGVSPRQLRRAFLQTFGMPLPEYLRRARLLRALEVMAAQPGKVEPVASKSGIGARRTSTGCSGSSSG